MLYTIKVEVLGTPPWVTVASESYPITDFNTTNVVTKTLQVTVPTTLAPGNYEFRVFVNVNTCEAVAADNYQTQTVTVTGGTGGDIDLELSMTTANPPPAIYSSSEIILTVNNTGTQTATGIVIEWKRPANTVYTGGNEWTATQGTFNPYGNEKWTVGSLPAGGSASLTVSYFYLTANALTPYAQVIAANEDDVDSTPGNGTCCMPNEDDEAAILINDYKGGSGVSLHKTDERQRLAFDRIYPNPAKYWVTVDIYALEDQEAVLDFYNQQGQSMLRMKVDLKKGPNEFELNVSNWRSGTYNIIGRGNSHPAYGRFLKVWED
ncbi:MAG: T9SS type A sorting domain-containing protein [Saprospiraceae bacterium]